MKSCMSYSRPKSLSRVLPHITATAAAILILLLTVPAALARGKPQIVRHEASFLEQSVVIVLQWQSPNPVVRVTAHVGGQKQEIEVDPYDNRRNQDGYWGEATVEVQAGPPSGGDGVPYLLQVEDDLRQKSERVQGKARVAAARPPEGAEDPWGRQHLERPGMPGQTGTGGQPSPYGGQPPPYGEGQYPPYNEGQYPAYGAGPTIQLIDVSVYGGQVTFTLQAFDQTGLQVITYRIYDMAGALVNERQIPSPGPEYYGPTEALPLPPGNYRVSAQAVGSSGTPSPEEVREFVVGDGETVAAEPPAGAEGGTPESSWEIPQDQSGGESGAEGQVEGSALPPGEDPGGRIQSEMPAVQGGAERVTESGSGKTAATEDGTSVQKEPPAGESAGTAPLTPRKPVLPQKPAPLRKPLMPAKPIRPPIPSAETNGTAPAGPPGSVTIPSPKGTGPGITVKLPAGGAAGGAPAIVIPGKGTIVASTTPPRPVELKNDGHVTGRPPDAYGKGLAGDEIAAVLGPVPQPFRVVGISVLCTGPTPPGALTVKVYEDSPGKNVPGRLLYSARAGSGKTGSPQVSLDLSGRNVVVPAGRVWIAVRNERAEPPSVAIDADGLSAGRNWLYRSGRWQEFGALNIEGNAIIRATVIPR